MPLQLLLTDAHAGPSYSCGRLFYKSFIQELVLRQEIRPGPATAASLYSTGNDDLLLRLSSANGSAVNPKETGYILKTLTMNLTLLPYGIGNHLGYEYWFSLRRNAAYSLAYHDQVVWTYGEPPSLGRIPSKVGQFSPMGFISRSRKFVTVYQAWSVRTLATLRYCLF
jgi:hypothetical protein